MKVSLLFLLMAFRCACGTPNPALQWDPETTIDCIEWYNNSEGESCEYVRSLFGITRRSSIVSVVLHRYHGEDQQHNHDRFIFFLDNDGFN